MDEELLVSHSYTVAYGYALEYTSSLWSFKRRHWKYSNVPVHGQWWSILTTQRLQILQ